jgi:hypothetical protein
MSARFARPFAVGGAVLAGVLLLMTLATQPTSASAQSASPAISWSALPLPTGTHTITAATRPKWKAATCATGAFGEIEVTADGYTLIPATATMCGDWRPGYSFNTVAFGRDSTVAYAHPDGLRTYANGAPTAVQAAFVSFPATSPVGVCLMRTEHDRIACIRIDRTAGGQLVKTPLPADDPLVAKPVQYVEDYLGGPIGVCATCLFLGIN